MRDLSKYVPGMPIEELDTPSLLIDLDKFLYNINLMADFFADKPTALRPHCKTHKSPRVAQYQLEAGAVGITCAKLSEAEVFANAGVEDILIANQITGPVKIARMTELAAKCNLMVAVDDPVNVEALDQACAQKGLQLRVLVEVDIGMKRCGVTPGAAALQLAQQVNAAKNLKFMGLQAYEGHLVLTKDPAEREQKVIESFAPLQETITLLEKNGLPVEIVSGGGTGTFDVSGTKTPLTEMQVGSYVFMDQTYNPVRPEFKPAMTILSTVVSRTVPGRLVTDAGLKSITSEFGWPTLLGIESATMSYLSEEHAVLDLADPDSVSVKPGEMVQFMPSHVCTTVNLHDAFFVHQNGVLVDVWPIEARGCAQ